MKVKKNVTKDPETMLKDENKQLIVENAKLRDAIQFKKSEYLEEKSKNQKNLQKIKELETIIARYTEKYGSIFIIHQNFPNPQHKKLETQSTSGKYQKNNFEKKNTYNEKKNTYNEKKKQPIQPMRRSSFQGGQLILKYINEKKHSNKTFYTEADVEVQEKLTNHEEKYNSYHLPLQKIMNQKSYARLRTLKQVNMSKSNTPVFVINKKLSENTVNEKKKSYFEKKKEVQNQL